MLASRPVRALSLVACCVALLGLPPVPSLADETESGAVRSLREAEIAFARSAADRDVKQFASFLDGDAIFVGGSRLEGAEAIVAGWAPFFQADGPTIEWRPESAEVTQGGLLGMTRGPYVVRSKAPDGTERESTGTFFSVWRRDSVEDPWRVVLDNGAPDKPCGDS